MVSAQSRPAFPSAPRADTLTNTGSSRGGRRSCHPAFSTLCLLCACVFATPTGSSALAAEGKSAFRDALLALASALDVERGGTRQQINKAIEAL